MGSLRRTLVVWCLALAAGLLLAAAAEACPTCKDNLAHSPNSQNLARGYAYSILFMLSMPPLIFGGLSAYFYWEVRRARALQRSTPPSPPAGSCPTG